VATGAGAFLPLAPVATLVGLATFAVVLAASRYVSLASVTASLALAAATFLTGRPSATCWTALVVAVFIIVKHHANLRRLLAGTESRLGAPSGEGVKP
jgi:glycerol-3-phosphate acyltransferase PlsY